MAMFRCGGEAFKPFLMFSVDNIATGVGTNGRDFIISTEKNKFDVMRLWVGNSLAQEIKTFSWCIITLNYGSPMRIDFLKNCKVTGGEKLSIPSNVYSAGTFITFNPLNTIPQGANETVYENMMVKIQEI